MTKINTIDRDNLRLITRMLQAKVDEVAQETGLEIKVGNARFSPRNATIKLEVNTIGDNGMAFTKEAENYRYLAPLLGLSVDWLGKSFIYKHEVHTLVGYMPKSTKFPMLATSMNGKEIKFTIETVRRYMASATKESNNGN